MFWCRDQDRSGQVATFGNGIVVAALLCLLGSASCTLDDGTGFARLSGRLWSSFAGWDQGTGRITGDGWYSADDAFELKLASMALGVREILVRGEDLAGTSDPSCRFDPSDPPPGCSLCHDDHCHCDGELTSYEELESRVCADGASSLVMIARLPVSPAAQDLLGEGARSDELLCEPSCELAAGRADQLQLVVSRLRLKAQLRDPSVADRLAGEQLAVEVDWDLHDSALSYRFDAPQVFARDQPYRFDLTVELSVSERLLDGVQWDQLERRQQLIRIDGTTNHDAGERLTANLSLSTLAVAVDRGD